MSRALAALGFVTIIICVFVAFALEISRPRQPRFKVECPDGLTLLASSAHPMEGMLRARDLNGDWWSLPPSCSARSLEGGR